MNTYEKFRKMMDNHIMLSFKGEITSDIITMVLQIMETRLDSVSEKGSVKKKIFNVLVECMQNLYHHSEAEEPGDINTRRAMLELFYDDEYYYILTGNYIKKDAIPPLRDRIDRVNSLSKEELRSYYRQILDNNIISDKGGADLGMIDMARKSGQKLFYDFHEATDTLSFFELRVKVAKKKPKK
ncbi:MAG: SiaB family protein kinase [Bacteroidales bacterium]|nr:SiaB family protein kinase [Bacteroidales bacterium]